MLTVAPRVYPPRGCVSGTGFGFTGVPPHCLNVAPRGGGLKVESRVRLRSCPQFVAEANLCSKLRLVGCGFAAAPRPKYQALGLPQIQTSEQAPCLAPQICHHLSQSGLKVEPQVCHLKPRARFRILRPLLSSRVCGEAIWLQRCLLVLSSMLSLNFIVRRWGLKHASLPQC